MRVYIVVSGVPYEGESIEGVYDNPDVALRHVVQYAQKYCSQVWTWETPTRIRFLVDGKPFDYIAVVGVEVQSKFRVLRNPLGPIAGQFKVEI